MKVRIHSGELRLRLLPDELDRLAEGGVVEEQVRLGEGSRGRMSFAVQGVMSGQASRVPDPMELEWTAGRALVRVDLEQLRPIRTKEDVELATVLTYDGEDLALVIERDLKPGRSRRPPPHDG